MGKERTVSHPHLFNKKRQDGFVNANAPITRAWLSFEYDFGDEIKYPLSAEQVKAIMYILGIEVKDELTGEISSFSDETLSKFIAKIKTNFEIVNKK